MKRLIPTFWIFLLGTVPVWAQTRTATPNTIVPDQGEVSRKGDMARLAQKKSEDLFSAADEDKDGRLSRTEVAKHLAFFDANFERYDKDKDGFLSWEEFVGHDKWKSPSKANY
jgi:Ca2+-binding EF-hand superfamily protein